MEEGLGSVRRCGVRRIGVADGIGVDVDADVVGVGVGAGVVGGGPDWSWSRWMKGDDTSIPYLTMCLGSGWRQVARLLMGMRKYK